MDALITLKKIKRGWEILGKGVLFYATHAEARQLITSKKARLATKEELAARSRKRKVTGPKERK